MTSARTIYTLVAIAAISSIVGLYIEKIFSGVAAPGGTRASAAATDRLILIVSRAEVCDFDRSTFGSAIDEHGLIIDMFGGNPLGDSNEKLMRNEFGYSYEILVIEGYFIGVVDPGKDGVVNRMGGDEIALSIRGTPGLGLIRTVTVDPGLYLHAGDVKASEAICEAMLARWQSGMCPPHHNAKFLIRSLIDRGFLEPGNLSFDEEGFPIDSRGRKIELLFQRARPCGLVFRADSGQQIAAIPWHDAVVFVGLP